MSPSELCEAVPGTGGSLSTGFTPSLLPPPHSSHHLNTPRLKTLPLKCCGMLQSSFCLPIFSHFMLQKSLYLIPFYGCGLGDGAGVRKSGYLYNPAIQCRSPEVWRFQTSIEISEGLGSFNRMSPSNMCYDVINFVLQTDKWKLKSLPRFSDMRTNWVNKVNLHQILGLSLVRFISAFTASLSPMWPQLKLPWSG